MDLIQFFDENVLPNLRLEEVLISLNPINKGGYFSVTCPQCHHNEAFIYQGSSFVQCNRKNKCGLSTNLFSCINGGTMPKSEKWVEILKQLCEQAGIEFPHSNFTPEQVSRYEKTTKQQQLYRDFVTLASDSLYDKFATATGNAALEYLQGEKRGWKLEQIKQFDFGYYQDQDWIARELEKKGYSRTEIQEAGIYRSDWSGRLVLPPHKDLRGNIVDFQLNDITGKVKPKYLRMKGNELKDTSVPYGLNESRGRDLIAVEGHFDQLMLTAMGINDVIALGGNSITAAQIEALEKNHTKSITLFLDHDEAGLDGTKKFIESLLDSSIDAFIIPPEKMSIDCDPDEFIRKEGATKVQDLYQQRIHAFKYYSMILINKHRPQNEEPWCDAQKNNLLQEVVDFLIKSNNSEYSGERRFWIGDFLKEIATCTPLDQESIVAAYNSRTKKGFEARLKQCHKDLEACLKSDDFDGARDLLKQNAASIGQANIILTISKITFIKDRPVNFLEYDAPDMPRLINVNDKGTIRSFIRKGIVAEVVGAGGIGKTHFLTQLAMSVATGSDFLEHFPVEQGHVLLVLGENADDDIHRLMRKIFEAMFENDEQYERAKITTAANIATLSVAGMDATFIDKNGNPTPFFDDLFNELKHKEPATGWSCIILDPISRFLGADAENDNAAATRFIALLERLTLELKGKPTVFFGHHMSKAGFKNVTTDQSDARGSSAITDGVRFQINLTKDKDGDEKETKSIKMKVVKNNFGPYLDEVTIKRNVNGYLNIKNSNSIIQGAYRDVETQPVEEYEVVDEAKPTQMRI